MLNGPIWNKLPRFAFPVAATAILEQLFNASDIAVVGNFTGAGKTVAVAAVGANSSVIALIVNLFVGIALGANVVIANAIGRDDREYVEKAVHTSVAVALLGGLFVAIVGEIVAGRSASLVERAGRRFSPCAYCISASYLIGMPVILLYNFEAAIFRSVGDTKTPLIVLAASGVLNVVLNLFFVAVLDMTVNGVAIATVISNLASSVLLMWRLIKSKQYIHLDLRAVRIDKNALGQIVKIGLPAGIQGGVFAVSNIVIQAAVNSLGTVVIAASSAAYNIEIFAILCAELFQPGVHHLRRAELRRGADTPLQKDAVSVPDRRSYRICRRHRSHTVCGQKSARRIQQRSRSRQHRIYASCHDILRIYFQHAV